MAMNQRKRMYSRIQQRKHEREQAAFWKREAAKGVEVRANLKLVRDGYATMDWFRSRQYERWPTLERDATRNSS